MNAEVLRVIAVDQPGIDDRYQRTLFGEEETFAGACTARSTIYTASIASGFMLLQLTKWLRRVPLDPDLLNNLFGAEMTVVAS